MSACNPPFPALRLLQLHCRSSLCHLRVQLFTKSLQMLLRCSFEKSLRKVPLAPTVAAVILNCNCKKMQLLLPGSHHTPDKQWTDRQTGTHTLTLMQSPHTVTHIHSHTHTLPEILGLAICVSPPPPMPIQNLGVSTIYSMFAEWING